jgi:hypothetical protein
MTTPIVTETRRNGNQVAKPTSGGQPTPADVHGSFRPPMTSLERRSNAPRQPLRTRPPRCQAPS